MVASALAVIAVLARRGSRTPWTSLLWLGVFFMLAMSASRAIVWWSMVAPIVVADLLPVGEQTHEHSTSEPKGPAVVIIGALVVAVLFLLPWWRPNDILSAPSGVTQAVIDHVPPGSKLFVHQPWGSWFEFATPDRPVYVDSRIEIIPKDVWDAYDQVGFAGADWKETLGAIHPDAIVAAADWDLLRDLRDDTAEWHEIYRDDDGSVFVPT
jgi:hypothetical protein